jgi:hypothetical protein
MRRLKCSVERNLAYGRAAANLGAKPSRLIMYMRNKICVKALLIIVSMQAGVLQGAYISFGWVPGVAVSDNPV